MPPGYKANATGRSTGKLVSPAKKLLGPPPEPWIWLPIALLASPAFQALSINARKILDWLCIEHMQHRQQENGRLYATYDQLEAFGISRRLIRSSLAELMAGGFVSVTQHGGMMGGERVAATYRLTFYAVASDMSRPTNAWKAASIDAVVSARRDVAAEKVRRRARNKARAKNSGDGCTLVNRTGAPS